MHKKARSCRAFLLSANNGRKPLFRHAQACPEHLPRFVSWTWLDPRDEPEDDDIEVWRVFDHAKPGRAWLLLSATMAGNLSSVMLGLAPSICRGSISRTWLDPRDKPEDDGIGVGIGRHLPNRLYSPDPYFCQMALPFIVATMAAWALTSSSLSRAASLRGRAMDETAPSSPSPEKSSSCAEPRPSAA
jgi:hypothetical protein